MASNDRLVTHRLGDLTEIVTSGFSPYGRSPSGHGDCDVGLIGTKDIRGGTVDFTHLERVTVPDADKLTPYRVAIGDVLVVIRGSVPRSAVCNRNTDGAVAGGNLAIIRLKPSAPIGPYLLQSILSAPSGQAALRGLAQGSATLAIRPALLAELEIGVPEAQEARRLENLCRTLGELRAATLAALRAREHVVDGIVGRYVRAS